MTEPSRPTRADLAAAAGKTLPDVIASDLDVLFVGINPGLYTAAIGHHFGRPGNRFWPALYAAGFTSRLMSPYEERELLGLKLGITNIVARASARADELSAAELLAGAVVLKEKVRHYRPRFVAVLGVTAYRTAFAQPKAGAGRQAALLEEAVVWVLPSPSGLNASFKVDLYHELRNEVARNSGSVSRTAFSGGRELDK
jgi:TDG/mug DNA glycosylase family protein